MSTTNTPPKPWVRTARGNPCPVCHCHAGCLARPRRSGRYCAAPAVASQIGTEGMVTFTSYARPDVDGLAA